MPRLLSVNVGLPRDISWRGRTVHTAVWKNAVDDGRMARRLNVDGDGQGDLVGHGGEQRAVFVYQTEAYRYWERQMGRSDFVFGQFGENFTIEGLSDDEVCIGDRYRIGNALFEVTQPRVTCYRIGIRMNEPRMPAWLYSHRRPGFYFRVLRQGTIKAGDDIIKETAGPERMSVADTCALLYFPDHPVEKLKRALRIPALSLGWQESFRELLEQAKHGDAGRGNLGLAPDAGRPPAWHGFRSLTVVERRRESRSVVSLMLQPSDARPLAIPQPGQFVAVSVQLSRDALPTIRSFSLSGAPSSDRYRISIKREPSPASVSMHLCDNVMVGDTLSISAPRGTFTLRHGPDPIVFISAGIGVTPVLAMLDALSASHATQPVWWLYGARNAAEHPFKHEVRAALATLQHARSWIAYSRHAPTDRLGVDFDQIGRLSLSVLQRLRVPNRGHFYLCGPSGFLHDFIQELSAFGVPPERVHTELFGPGPSLTPGVVNAPPRLPHSLPATPGSAHVSFARTGVDAGWTAPFGSLLELAEACDVPVRWSCRTGVCHTCQTGIVQGEVGYSPEPLEMPADGTVLICCAQPRGQVVLDL